MGSARLLLNQTLHISGRYRVELKVFEVNPSKKYPEGVKVRFALIDVVQKKSRLLIDNHAPYGFHVHTKLPEDKNARRVLKTKAYVEALDEFWRLSKEIIRNEN